MSSHNWRRLVPPRGDLILVLALSTWYMIILVSYWIVPPPPGGSFLPARVWAEAGMSIAFAVPLLYRRRLPLVAFGVQMAGVALWSEQVPDQAFFPIMIGVYSAAAYHPRRWVSLGALTAAALWAAIAVDDVLPGIPDELMPFVLILPLWLLGNQIRLTRARADRLARERDAAAAAAIAQERARVAHELHDVVTHNVSVMVIQASAARQVIATDPGAATDAMGAVEHVGQQAMAELRHLLDLLGPPDDAGTIDLAEAPPRPQPGLGQLEMLLRRVRSAGLSVTAQTTGSPRPLAPGLDVAAYRVVQESLTNVLRHAPGAPAAVSIDYGPTDLVVEVSNQPPPGPPERRRMLGLRPDGHSGTGGRGLLGLAERVRLYHGELHARRTDDGGYRVLARIPWSPAA